MSNAYVELLLIDRHCHDQCSLNGLTYVRNLLLCSSVCIINMGLRYTTAQA